MANEKTAAEIIGGYFNEFVKLPVKKTWKPSDFDREYYNTPKKMEREAAKRDAEYQREFDRQMRDYNEMKSALEKVCAVQLGLMDFFAESLDGWIRNARARRAALSKKIKDFKAAWDKAIPYTYIPSNPKDSPYESTVNPYQRRHELLRRCWKCELRNGYIFTEKSLNGELDKGDYFCGQQMDAIGKTDEEKTAFLKAAIQNDLDEQALRAAVTPQEIFTLTLTRLGEIVDAMVKVLGGMPDGFERGHEWGVGGQYNGIVSRQGKRAKFTSFYAGGWNIQRLHIRYRVTLLKA